MASATLKEDIKLLEKLFLKKLSKSSSSANTTPSINCLCFRIISANLDELVCEFIDTNTSKKYRINANISEMYPQTPPVWSYENEDVAILDIIEKLSTTSKESENRVRNFTSVSFLVMAKETDGYDGLFRSPIR